MLKLYKFLTIILYPFLISFIYIRQIRGKEDTLRIKERFGYASLPRPKSKLIWIHAISIGEAVSVMPLINNLLDKYPEHMMMITTGTVTSAKIMLEKLPDRAFHQYIPIDSIICVRRFLKHWNPDFILWVESELWPNLICEARRYSRLVMINGRISKDSVSFWQKFPTMINKIIGNFDLILTQSKIDLDRFTLLGGKNIEYLGNLKIDAPPLSYDPKMLSKFINWIGERTVFIAASTHEGEEKMIMNVHKKLKKKKYPDLLTIIIPRHPERGKDILQELASLKCNIAMRSKNEPITNDIDCYISDSLGELGLFYRLSNIIFIGGSLVPIGGHNPLEAIRLENVVIYGANMDNFLSIAHELQLKKAGIMVQDEEELNNVLDYLLSDYDTQEKYIKASKELLAERQGVLEIVINKISEYI